MAALAVFLFFFFNDTATTEIYTLSLHDALPICDPRHGQTRPADRDAVAHAHTLEGASGLDAQPQRPVARPDRPHDPGRLYDAGKHCARPSPARPEPVSGSHGGGTRYPSIITSCSI